MSFIKKHWGKLLTGAILLTGGIWLYRRNKDEEQSGFANGTTKVVQFTLTNNTGSQQQLALFNARALGSGTGNDMVGISPSIGTFNRSLFSEPKKVLSIAIKAPQPQANQPLGKVCQDASGESAGETFYPSVSANQVQPDMVTVQPGNLVLDGGCYLTYSIAPNTRVSMTVTYMVLDTVKKPKRRRKK